MENKMLSEEMVHDFLML